MEIKTNNKKNHEQGFTIIELIAVIGILGLMYTVILVNFHTTQPARNLKAGTNQLASDLHLVQSYALNSQDISPGVHASAYGIDFNAATPSSYQIVAYDDAAPVPNKTVIGTVILPSQIFFGECVIARPSGNVTVPQDEILFTTPYGAITQSFSNSSGTVIATGETDDQAQVILYTPPGATNYSQISVDGITGNIRQH